ncbi:hypothetical protein CDEST_11830 [Colletotrichum destructivum]|uniref:Uncharacterized protein n=1 Tax=Colletotrichum destructivum TaxID=34406 RepID=A0AAX4IUF2_9PEZI|nr:hypothetical protein CDEST_11830 [Colletotrichum destructivum]
MYMTRPIMDDVLISQLSPHLLRSSVRLLISQGPSTRTLFLKHVQARLTASPVPFPDSHALVSDDGGLSSQTLEYLAWNRCLLSAKLAQQAIEKYVGAV